MDGGSTGEGEGQLPAFALTIQAAPDLSTVHKVALLRAAIARNPAAAPLREQLAALLATEDNFEGAIAVLEDIAAPGAGALLLLNDAYLTRRSPAGDRQAEAAARAVLAMPGEDRRRVVALAALGKALIRQQRLDEARAVLTEALAIDRHQVDAYKRLATILAGEEPPAKGLAAAEALIGDGVAHAYLLGSHAAALARNGRVAEAREAIGLDRFLDRRIIAVPPGWPSLAAFNADIAAELSRRADVRYDRYATASVMTWRIDRPLTAASPALAALGTAIGEAVHDYVGRAAARDDTPWLRARPAAGLLGHSCVITDADGFETWHLHEHGWLSGVYYADVPVSVAQGTGRDGCLAFGLPEELASADVAAAYGEQIVRPEPGLLLLFPSHAFHRTYAHGSDQRRICLAFDVQPC